MNAPAVNPKKGNFDDGLEAAARLLDKEGARLICEIVNWRKNDGPGFPYEKKMEIQRDMCYDLAKQIRELKSGNSDSN